MPGRKRKLDEARQREICALVSAGCDFEQAARYAGCSSVTIRRESARNPEFYERLRQAKLSAEITPLQAIRKAASSHWRAAAWLLERTEPERYVRCTSKTFTYKELTAYCDKIMNIVLDQIDDPETMLRIEDKVVEVASETNFDCWVRTASYDQLRKAFKHAYRRPRPVEPTCGESRPDCRTAGAQNGTESTPILSDPEARNSVPDGLSTDGGTTE